MNTDLILSHLSDSSVAYRYAMLQESLNNLLKGLGILEIKPNDVEVLRYIICRSSTILDFNWISPIYKSLSDVKDITFDDFVAFFGLDIVVGYEDEINRLVKLYIERKQNHWINPDTRNADITASTYGLYLFRSQTEEIFRRITGASKEEAELFRRNIQKGVVEAVLFGDKFIEMGLAKGYDRKYMQNIWNEFEKSKLIKADLFYCVTSCWLMYQVAYLEYYYSVELEQFIQENTSVNHLNKEQIISSILTVNKV